MKEQPQKVVPDIQLMALKTMMQQKQESRRTHGLLRKSFSCPCFTHRNDYERGILLKTRSFTLVNQKIFTKCKFQFLRLFWCPQQAYSSSANTSLTANISNELKNVCSVCVCPPSGCCCLPPPCNQPAKCLQNITGYYYYPYGTWFCGPYHIKTGPCGPCAGPVQPGGPCGPAPPNPGGPCGPAGVVLCGPGANCAQCRCAPCPAPCGTCCPSCACGACGPSICGPCGPCQPCYDPYSPCGLPGACAPCGSCGFYSICNGPCGPCYNIPCVPIQVCGPIRPGGPCGPVSNPLDFCSKCCLYPDTGTDTIDRFKASTSISSAEMNSASEPGSKSATVSAPSRINLYPTLVNSANIYEPISKLHQSAIAAGFPLQVRHYTTVARTGSKLNDPPMTKSQNGVLKVKSTFNRCCHRPWSNCSLISNSNIGCRCPPLCQPRCLPSKEERDWPCIPPNCFSYSNTPNYRNPSPYTDILEGVYCKRSWS